MNQVTPDWLKQLAPAHAPPPPGWWPPTPGWWGLLILLLIALGSLIYWQTRPALRVRRLALHELKKIKLAITEDRELAQALENLMRRYALARFGRDTVASLSGARWLAFVVEHGGSALSGESGASLLRTAYGGANAANRTAWLNGAEAFIKGRSHKKIPFALSLSKGSSYEAGGSTSSPRTDKGAGNY